MTLGHPISSNLMLNLGAQIMDCFMDLFEDGRYKTAKLLAAALRPIWSGGLTTHEFAECISDDASIGSRIVTIVALGIALVELPIGQRVVLLVSCHADMLPAPMSPRNEVPSNSQYFPRNTFQVILGQRERERER